NNVFYIYNIDDYYVIHEIRRPDTVLISSAKHFIIYVAKPVMKSSSVLLIFNQVSIHNPSNVKAWRPYWVLQKQLD
ncbi:173_t:CDS:2, partial [Dentiscutata heterogama]